MKPIKILYILALTAMFAMAIFSCSKQAEKPVTINGCDSCVSSNITRSVTIEASHWESVGGGVFKSEFGRELTIASGGYHNILDIFLSSTSTGQEVSLEAGSSVSTPQGRLSLAGTTLFMKADYTMLPFNPIYIRVLVN